MVLFATPLRSGGGLIRRPGSLGDSQLGELSPATLEININGTVGSSQFDYLDVDGIVSLDGTLDLALNTVPVLGETYVFINNDDVDPVSGTFTALPQGPILSETYGAISYDFRIDYFADTGNDVALTVVPEPATLSLLAIGGLAVLRRRRS